MSNLSQRYCNPNGKEETFSDRLPHENWEEVLSLDPAQWESTIERFQTLTTFSDWLHAGGQPTPLSPEEQEVLQRLDEVFTGQALPSPFFPFLALVPSQQPVAISRRWSNRQLEGYFLARKQEGWQGTAVFHLNRMQEQEETMLGEIEAYARGNAVSPDFPGLGVGNLANWGIRKPDHGVLEKLWRVRSQRVASTS
jgi:hypothetical protein